MSCRQGDDFARLLTTSAVEQSAEGETVSTRRNRRRPVAERFWEKVQQLTKEECWPWTASKDEVGYGRFWCDGKTVAAHRFAYELVCGRIEGGRFVMHACDNPSCCNPKHLSLGTAQENSTDMLSKGRQACGEKHGRHKLTSADVEAILRSKEPLRTLSDRYRISDSVVSSIRRRKHWQHRR